MTTPIEQTLLCGFTYRVFDNSIRACVRKRGHEGGHNAFSDTPSPNESKAKLSSSEQQPTPSIQPTTTQPSQTEVKIPPADLEFECMWASPQGKCSLPLNHEGDHKVG